MWLCPSVMRPHNIERLALVTHDVPLTIRLHQGDPMLAEYKKLDMPEKWKVAIGPDCACGGAWQWAFETFPDEKFYGFIGDDCVPQTEGWEEKLSEAAGDWAIAYPDDGMWGEKQCTHPCIGGDLVRAAGFWGMPTLEHNFIDGVWLSIGKALGLLAYVDEVKFDHRHWRNEKAVEDVVYLIGDSLYEKDEAAYREYGKSGAFRSTIMRISKARLEAGEAAV